MSDLNLKYNSDPTGDIITRGVQIFFGQRAITETIAVNKISGTGMFSKVEKSISLGDKTINGVGTSLGVAISYTILSQQIQFYAQTISMQVKSSTTYVAGELDVKVSWESYMPNQSSNSKTNSTSNNGKVVPDLSPIEQEIIIKTGFDLKCRDTTDIEDRGNGEILGDDYINALIPDVAHGYRVGDNLILESLKNIAIGVNCVPHFRIKSRQYVQVPVSYLFLNEILKVDGLDFHLGSGADQAFVVNTRGRQY